jgi:hypothetical protein
MTQERRHRRLVWLAIVSTSTLLLAVGAGQACAAASRATAAAKVFPEPRAAVDALLAACRTGDEVAFVTIFGEEARPLVRAAADREGCRRFVDSAKQMTRLDPVSPNTL